MNKVITINLNGNAFQLEEQGYELLRRYLEQANNQLAGNPDKDEILADLEQAIAEKCSAYLRAHKTVVLTAEVEQVVRDMGPVEGGDAQQSASQTGASGAAAEAAAAAGAGSAAGTSTDGAAAAGGNSGGDKAPRRLYQIREGAKISGVCMGLAAFFNIDVTLVRIGFVVLAFLTGGGWVLAYIVMMFVIPVATTTEERAAAHGMPFSAQELIDRAKKQYSEFKDNEEWKQHWRKQKEDWRQQRREWQEHWRNQTNWWGNNLHRSAAPVAQSANYGAQILAGIMVPVLGLLSALFFLALVLTIISLATSSALFGWPLPNGMPLWLGIVLVIVLYNFCVWPLHALRRASYYGVGGQSYAWVAAWDGLLRFGIVALALWYGYEHIPQVRDFIDHLPQIWDNLWRNAGSSSNSV